MGKSSMLAALAFALAPAAAHAQDLAALRQRVEAALATAPAGARIGLLVVDEAGREIVAINPDQRFIPASNTKLFTTAAALDILGRDSAAAEADGLTSLALGEGAAPDVILTGRGAPLSTAPDCTRRCLGGLVSAIAEKAGRVGNVIADDSAFPDQRWSPGMSWNNIGTSSGTAISALVVDDNELPLVIRPGAVGAPATIAVSPYFTAISTISTVAEGETAIAIERPVNSRVLRLSGVIRADAVIWQVRLGIDDPADYAAWAVREALLARQVKVAGKVLLRHRAIGDPAPAEAAPPPARFVLGVAPAPLHEEVATINKTSQNLRAEVLLRRIGRSTAQVEAMAAAPEAPAVPGPVAGSIESGLVFVRDMARRAGIAPAALSLSDGSGMSSYNRMTPRAAVTLLRWGKAQPWGAAWRASLPIGGTDGTLRRRFAGTPLQGRLWAKTGALNASNALSGYLQSASGRELTFSIIANDVPDGTNAVPSLDAAILAVAAGG